MKRTHRQRRGDLLIPPTGQQIFQLSISVLCDYQHEFQLALKTPSAVTY